MPKPIVVIGSINMDLVCRTRRIPVAGETILGENLLTIPGGKGANQAVAAAKLGGDVHFIGRVGEDDFGTRLLTGLRQHNVNTRYVTVTEGVSSGCAMILVDKKGENTIVVAPGANARLGTEDIDRAKDLIATAGAVVMQLEIPVETVNHAISLCKELNVPTVLDPAPVPPRGLSKIMWGVDLLTPNMGEAEALLALTAMGRMHRTKSVDAKQIGADLLSRGPGSVVLKLGRKGAMVQARDGHIEQIKPFKFNVVDTTAAGDAFTGALAVGVASGWELSQSARFANAAGALTCITFGAQPSLPSREAVEKLLKK
jgi:ribokinase